MIPIRSGMLLLPDGYEPILSQAIDYRLTFRRHSSGHFKVWLGLILVRAGMRLWGGTAAMRESVQYVVAEQRKG